MLQNVLFTKREREATANSGTKSKPNQLWNNLKVWKDSLCKTRTNVTELLGSFNLRSVAKKIDGFKQITLQKLNFKAKLQQLSSLFTEDTTPTSAVRS